MAAKRETVTPTPVVSDKKKALETAMQQIEKLAGCDAHFSVILSSVDETTFKRLGVNMTCQPRYEQQHLYHK